MIIFFIPLLQNMTNASYGFTNKSIRGSSNTGQHRICQMTLFIIKSLDSLNESLSHVNTKKVMLVKLTETRQNIHINYTKPQSFIKVYHI